MGSLVGKIVLTGGPCAGKTTALSRIEQELTERGYKVFVVSESATDLIKSGIRPFGDKAFDLLNFQRLILKCQKEKEALYEKAVEMLLDDDKVVILCDRGIMDNKAYIPKEFKDIAAEQNLNELDMLTDYDMVIHMVTAAIGCPEYYTLENNAARSESIEEATDLDNRTRNAWIGHNRLVIVDNSTNFEDKLNRVCENIYQAINLPYGIRYQRKYLIDLAKSNLDFLDGKDVNSIHIDQTYLKSREDGYERRLRKLTKDGEVTYYLTVQKKAKDGLSKISTDKKITAKEYLSLIELEDKNSTISKTRYTFVHNNQYFKLDVFDNEDLALLEVNPIDSEQKVDLPNDLTISKEVTDDHDYDNVVLANRTKKQAKQKVKVEKNNVVY